MKGSARWLTAVSLLFGLGYPLLWALPLPPAAMIAVKGSAVGLLALAAALRARTANGGLLAALLALGATGDVLIEIDLAAGAAAFAGGHVVAIALYLRNRRAARPPDWAIAALLPVLAALLPALLLRGRPEAMPFTLYALLLGTMAATAWLSRFPRLVALGASLFLASDMLIALRMAGGVAELSLAIWLLYYLGQLMIFLGVSASLTAKRVGRGTTRERPACGSSMEG
jgi:uncharacterized membrane protein YhhN